MIISSHILLTFSFQQIFLAILFWNFAEGEEDSDQEEKPEPELEKQMGDLEGAEADRLDDQMWGSDEEEEKEEEKVTDEDVVMKYNDGLVQDCSISSALALEMLQSCIKLSMWLINIGIILMGWWKKMWQ